MKPVAYKLKIEDLIQGQYIRSIEGAEPSYVLTPWGLKITRARVMGTIVDKFVREDQAYATIRIDDGSGTISIRAWREGVPELDKLQLGDIVDIIGRVREFEGEIYLVPDMIIPVKDINWELVRELEILESRREALAKGVRPTVISVKVLEPTQLKIETPPPAPVLETLLEEEEPPLPSIPEEIKKQIILALEKLDKGNGASPAEISTELKLPQSQVEDALRVLLVEGDIYEPQAGMFKLTR